MIEALKQKKSVDMILAGEVYQTRIHLRCVDKIQGLHHICLYHDNKGKYREVVNCGKQCLETKQSRRRILRKILQNNYVMDKKQGEFKKPFWPGRDRMCQKR